MHYWNGRAGNSDVHLKSIETKAANCAIMPVMDFWNRVEILRKQCHTTYRQLAAVMGVSETTVSSMRRAGTEPRAGDAVKIACELGTTVEYLATGVASEVGDNYREKYFELKEKIIKLGNSD